MKMVPRMPKAVPRWDGVNAELVEAIRWARGTSRGPVTMASDGGSNAEHARDRVGSWAVAVGVRSAWRVRTVQGRVPGVDQTVTTVDDLFHHDIEGFHKVEVSEPLGQKADPGVVVLLLVIEFCSVCHRLHH